MNTPYTKPSPNKGQGNQIPINQSQSTASFRTYYFENENLDFKKNIIDRVINKKPTQEEFDTLLKCIMDEPEDYYWRCEVFEYFIETLRAKSPVMLEQFIGKEESFFKFIFEICSSMDYIGIYIREVGSRFGYSKDFQAYVLQKIESMTKEQRIASFYISDVEKFIKFKKDNPGRSYKEVNNQKQQFLKKTISRVYNVLDFIKDNLDPKFLISVITRWLLIVNLKRDVSEYRFVRILIDLLMGLANTPDYNVNRDDTLKNILVNILELLQIEYLLGDPFESPINLVLAIESMEFRDLKTCVVNYFSEILEGINIKKEAIFQMFYNLTMRNYTDNACFLMSLLSENFAANQLFAVLVYNFEKVIIRYSVAKLKVDRIFTRNLELCQFYFYGLSNMGYTLPESLLDDLIELLQLFRLEAKTDVNRARFKLAKYIDFLDIVCRLYGQHSANKYWVEKLQQYIPLVIQEFRIPKTENERNKMFKEAQASAWDFSQDDLDKSIILSDNETVHPQFKVNFRYKGIKNIGNTCYIACTMQVLYHTPEFREEIMKLEQDIVKANDPRIKDNILGQTINLFRQLDTEKPEPEHANPKFFREALPEQFRSAKEEQDTSEFFKIYLDKLEHCINQINKKVK